MRGLARLVLALALAAGPTACTVLFPFDSTPSEGAPAKCDPVAVSTTISESASALDVADGFVWVGAWNLGLDVYRLDAPGAPTRCATREIVGGTVKAVHVVEDRVLVAGRDDLVGGSFLLRQTLAPGCAAEPTEGLGWGGVEAFDITAEEGSDDVWVAARGGLEAWDLSPAPPEVGGLPGLVVQPPDSEIDATAVAFTSTHVYVAMGWGGTVTASDRVTYGETQIAAGEMVRDVAVDAGRLFVARGYEGLLVREALPGTHELAHRHVGRDGFAIAVVVDDPFVFVCGGEDDDAGPGFLEALWIGPDGRLESLFIVDEGLPSACHDLDVDAEYVYLADDDRLDVISRGCAVH